MVSEHPQSFEEQLREARARADKEKARADKEEARADKADNARKAQEAKNSERIVSYVASVHQAAPLPPPLAMPAAHRRRPSHGLFEMDRARMLDLCVEDCLSGRSPTSRLHYFVQKHLIEAHEAASIAEDAESMAFRQLQDDLRERDEQLDHTRVQLDNVTQQLRNAEDELSNIKAAMRLVGCVLRYRFLNALCFRATKKVI